MTSTLTPITSRGFRIVQTHPSNNPYRPCRCRLSLLLASLHRPVFVRSSVTTSTGHQTVRHLHPKSRANLKSPSRPLSSSAYKMATNGELRPKRRASPVHAFERPTKHLKADNIAPTPGDATPQNGTVYNVESEVNPAPIMNPLTAAPDSPEWQATIENVIKSVVSIHFCQTCSFDTDLSMSSQATGFVVDAERGYIMTNRHVVCAGPFWGYCLFENHEEVCHPVSTV